MSPEVQFEQFKLVVVTVTLILHTDLESHIISRFERVMILDKRKHHSKVALQHFGCNNSASISLLMLVLYALFFMYQSVLLRMML